MGTSFLSRCYANMYIQPVTMHTHTQSSVRESLATTHCEIVTIAIQLSYIPYSAKFSRRIIFAVFVDSFQTVKIKLGKCFPQNVIKLAPSFCDAQ